MSADPLNAATPLDSAFAKVAAEELRALKGSVTSRLATTNANVAANAAGIATINSTALPLKLDRAGGTMTGALTLAANPTGSLQAATKSYVDSAVSTISGISTLNTFRNKIINGNFDIWQIGNSQTSSGYGSDDRWSNGHNGGTKTHSLQVFPIGQTAVPGNPKYFSRTVFNSVAGANNYCQKAQPIESVLTLAGGLATVSFWAKADAPKNMAIELVQYFGTGGSPSAFNTINLSTVALTTSWQKFTFTSDIPSIAGKTLGTNGNDNLALQLWFDAGSNWSARTNNLGHQSGTFDIAQVQLEAGAVATPFEQRPIALELSLCQRYLEIAEGAVTSGYPLFFFRGYRVQKRAAPTVTLIGGALGGANMGTITTIGFRWPDNIAASSTTGATFSVSAEL